MSGATAGGWPYVTPEDHPLEFPTLSQQLATKLQAEITDKVAAGSRGVLSAVYADVSGIKTIGHTLGRIPTRVHLTPAGGIIGVSMQKLAYIVLDVTATTLRVVVVDTTNGSAVTNVSQRIAFYYDMA